MKHQGFTVAILAGHEASESEHFSHLSALQLVCDFSRSDDRYFELDLPPGACLDLLRRMQQFRCNNRNTSRCVALDVTLGQGRDALKVVISSLGQGHVANQAAGASARAALAASSFCTLFMMGEGAVSAFFVRTVR